MLTLHRTVRFAINPGDDPGTPPIGHNGYAGVPAMRGLGRHYELEITCRGEAHPVTGYFMDIKSIDRAARSSAIPVIAHAVHRDPLQDPGSVLREVWGPLNAALGGTLDAVAWALTPYYRVVMNARDTGKVILRQRFEFAAAHRLHAPSLSDEENRRTFGRCNNPSGHGHNYIVEPAIAVDAAGGALNLVDLEALVHEAVIERLDHKNLNCDVPELDPARGLNPSVENIAQVCYRWLAHALRERTVGRAELRSVTVWETEKTSATFPG